MTTIIATPFAIVTIEVQATFQILRKALLTIKSMFFLKTK